MPETHSQDLLERSAVGLEKPDAGLITVTMGHGCVAWLRGMCV